MIKGISLFDLAKIFLVLGATAFGGYTALVAMIQKELVDKGQVLSQQIIYDGILVASMIPGPLAVNVVIAIGYHLRGWLGALVSGISILLPSCSMIIISALFISEYFDFVMLKIMIGFLIPVVVAVILSVSFKMFKNEVTHYWQMISALAALLALIFTSINLLTSILIGGLIGFLWGEKKVLNIQDHLEIKSIQYLGVGVGICLSFFIFLFFLLPSVQQSLLVEFSKVSLTLFGGGYVMIQAIHDVVVNQFMWVSSDEFNQAIALGQLTPGPILVSATYIGFKAAGLLGAFAATVGIFMPAGLFMLLASHLFKSMPNNKWLNAVISGIKPIIVAFILYSAYVVMRPIGFDVQSISLAIIALVMINYLHINFLWLMLGSGMLSLFFI